MWRSSVCDWPMLMRSVYLPSSTVCVRIELAARVEALQQPPVRVVARPQPEAHQVQRDRRGQLEARIVAHPAGELLRQRHVPPDVMPQPLHAVMPDHEPQLERAEPPPQRDLPVAIVDHRARLRRLVPQILRQDAQRADQRGAVGHVEARRSRSW